MIAGIHPPLPKVRLELHQGSPSQVCDMVLSGDADLVIATEAIPIIPIW